jgi:metal-responsive CopG/Arc/MetJ family transcriptional regulator
VGEIRISKKSRDHGDDGHKIISLRIRQDMLERIEYMANKTDRSRNEVINILLSAALENAVVVE